MSTSEPVARPTEELGHTPGPWEIRSRHESSMDHTTVIRSVAIPGHDYIAISRIVDPTPHQDQVARANVRLIAGHGTDVLARSPACMKWQPSTSGAVDET
jgi:hypothetical protein